MPENEAAAGRKSGVNTFQQLLQNKRVLMIGGIVLALLVVVGISTIFILNRPTAKPVTTGSTNTGEAAEVLPQVQRDNGLTGGSDLFARDPFAAPLRLTGLITGGAGGSMAIVESSGTTYVVIVGDVIDEFWTVLKISLEEVLITSGDREVSLRLHHRLVEEQSGEAAEEDA
jgi:hypothetical protein